VQAKKRIVLQREEEEEEEEEDEQRRRKIQATEDENEHSSNDQMREGHGDPSELLWQRGLLSAHGCKNYDVPMTTQHKSHDN
jgi:hypothetical protein